MRIRTFILLTAAPCAVFGQASFELTDQRAPIVHHTAVAATDGGEWMFAGWAQDMGEARAFLDQRTDNGLIVSNPITLNGPVAVPQWLMRAPDGGFVVVGVSPNCSLPVHVTGFVRTDAAGQVVQQAGHGALRATAAATSPFGTAVGGGDVQDPAVGRLWTLDNDGLTVLDLALTEDCPQGIAWTGTGDLLLLFADRIEERSSVTGDEIVSAALTTGALGLSVLADGTIATLYTDQVLLLDEAFAVTGTIGWNASAARWMEYQGGHLWVTCVEDIVQADVAAGTATVFDQPAGTVTVNGSAMGDGLMLFAGSRAELDRSSGVIRGRSLVNGPVEAVTDIAIHVHSIDSLYFQTDPLYPQIVVVHVRHTLALTNMGGTTIEQVRINSQRTLPFCGADHRVDTLLHLEGLLPGGTALVQMPVLTSWPIQVPVDGTAYFSPCYVALAPNAEVDAEATNDHTCTDIPVTVPTAITELDALPGPSIHPVPFREGFTMRREHAPDAQVVLRDGIGRELAWYRWPMGDVQLSVDAAALPMGLLLVEYTDGQRQQVLRAVRW